MLVRKRHFDLFFRSFLSNGTTITSQMIEKPASNWHCLLTQIITRQTHNVFTNEQLATMVQLPMVSKADLQNIPGIGKTRLEKYAEPFLQLLARTNNHAQARKDA